MQTLISRPDYTKRIEPFIGKNIIKVLTGQRRVGKSCILRQLMQHVRETDTEANVIYINKEYEIFTLLRSHEDLTRYIDDRLVGGKNNYVFIDEIQDIDGFEHTLRSFQAQESCDFFVTGSNATMLSGELATYLSGRYVEFHIHSLSYAEFLEFHRLDNCDESLRKYLTYGGLPYLVNLPLETGVVSEYLANVYSTILLKDIVKREGVRNVGFLETLAVYTADNVGNLFSANNISKYLKSQRVSISTSQVINYLSYMQNAYLISRVGRVDVTGLKRFEIGDKYYFEDLGLRNCHLGFNLSRDIHRLIENAVFNHLSRLRYQVFTGQQSAGREIDFVARRSDWTVYIQVAYLLDTEITREREYGNLRDIRDNYPKYVVTLDPWVSSGNVDGIMTIHLRDFLLKTSL